MKPQPLPPRFSALDAQTLVARARDRLSAGGGPWTADDPADPGLTLLEAAAQIAADQIAVANALPTRLQERFLSMLGASRIAGEAQSAEVTFTLDAPRQTETVIPTGTRIAATDRPDVVFTLFEPVRIAPGAVEANADLIRAERVPLRRVGLGTGSASQRVVLPHDDLPAAPAAAARVEILVTWLPSQPKPQDVALVPLGGQLALPYGVRGSVSGAGDGAEEEEMPIVILDRAEGQLRFPSSGPYVPPDGAEIWASYAVLIHGQGGTTLNPRTLTDPLDPLPGLRVTNAATSVPGVPAQSAREMLEAGPLAPLTRTLVVRARDYEEQARRASGRVARAHALTPSETWHDAPRGLVRVLIAPKPLGAPQAGSVGLLEARAAQPDLPETVRRHLSAIAPLGVRVVTDWIPALEVGISARIFVARDTDEAALSRALDLRLGALLSPTASAVWPTEGWPLGRPLRLSEVIETLLAVPGVRAVDRVRLCPRDPMQGPVTALSRDARQAGLWFAAMGGRLYRSLNHGRGWARILPQAGPVVAVSCHPVRPGLLAAAGADGRIWRSDSAGMDFALFARTPDGQPPADALLWADGGETPRVLASGPGGLCETRGPQESAPEPPELQPLMAQDGWVGPTIATASYADPRGGRFVAAVRDGLGGIVLSADSGWNGGFEPLPMDPLHDVRCLAFAEAGGRVLLLAGCARPPVSDLGIVLATELDPVQGHLVGPWRRVDAGWPGAACSVLSLAVDGDTIFAGTERMGLVRGTLTALGGIDWSLPSPDSGLPLDERGLGPAPLPCIAVGPRRSGAGPQDVALGGPNNLLLSRRGGHFAQTAIREGVDRIDLPHDWTLCAGSHDFVFEDADA